MMRFLSWCFKMTWGFTKFCIFTILFGPIVWLFYVLRSILRPLFRR